MLQKGNRIIVGYKDNVQKSAFHVDTTINKWNLKWKPMPFTLIPKKNN